MIELRDETYELDDETYEERRLRYFQRKKKECEYRLQILEAVAKETRYTSIEHQQREIYGDMVNYYSDAIKALGGVSDAQ